MAVEPQQLSALVAETTGTPKGARDHLVPIQRTVTRGDKVFEQRFWVNPNKGERVAREVRPPEIKFEAAPAFKGLDAIDMGDFARANEMQIRAIGEQMAKTINPYTPRNLTGLISGESADRMLEQTGIPGVAAEGCFTESGIVGLNSSSMIGIRQSIADKEVTMPDQLASFAVLSHEIMHAASPEEGIEYEDVMDSERPHRAMQEGTTELLGRHYTMELARACAGSIAADVDQTFRDQPLFTWDKAAGDVKPRMFTSYRTWTRQFARAAVYAEAAQGLADKDLHRIAVGWAAKVKPFGSERRYEMLAERILSHHKIDASHPSFDHGRKWVADRIKDFVQADKPMTALDAAVGQVVKDLQPRHYGIEAKA